MTDGRLIQLEGDNGRVTADVQASLESGALCIEAPCGEIDLRNLPAGPLSRFCFWVSADEHRLALAHRDSESLQLVDLSTCIADSEPLFRDEEDDLRFLTCKVSPVGLLLLYEQGLLLLGNDARVAWHVQHFDVSARITQVDDSTVEIESQWPEETAGHRRLYSLRDGRLVGGDLAQ